MVQIFVNKNVRISLWTLIPIFKIRRINMKQTIQGIKINVPTPLNIRILPNGEYEVYFTEAF